MGPQVLARACCSAGLPTGSQPPLGIHLLWRGVFHGLQVEICSTVDLHGLQGHSLTHHGLHHGLQGKLCSGAWTTSSPALFPDLGVCRVVSLTLSHSSLPLQVFVPLRKSVIPEALPPSLMGLALARGLVHLGASWHLFCRTRGKFLAASDRRRPATKPLPHKHSAQ